MNDSKMFKKMSLVIDGKGMQVSNHMEGCKCWTCDLPTDQTTSLAAQDSITRHVRFGAFLRHIPPVRRIGHFVHCTGRLVNAILKPLENNMNMTWDSDNGRFGGSSHFTCLRAAFKEAVPLHLV